MHHQVSNPLGPVKCYVQFRSKHSNRNLSLQNITEHRPDMSVGELGAICGTVSRAF